MKHHFFRHQNMVVEGSIYGFKDSQITLAFWTEVHRYPGCALNMSLPRVQNPSVFDSIVPHLLEVCCASVSRHTSANDPVSVTKIWYCPTLKFSYFAPFLCNIYNNTSLLLFHRFHKCLKVSATLPNFPFHIIIN